MKILMSNDDGVFARGLQVLYDELNQTHDITVLAPDRNCSGMSNALSLRNPLRLEQRENGFISVNGTPSDCAHIGINAYLQSPPDLVVSGINHGPNLGDDVIYSGTVAAATEGRHLGFPALAVSLAGKPGVHFETAAIIVQTIVERIQDHPLANNQILNINVPDLPMSELKGLKVTRLGNRHKADTMIKQADPMGHEIYWYGAIGSEQDAGIGTDFHAIAAGYASVTPISVDMTDHAVIEQLRTWIE